MIQDLIILIAIIALFLAWVALNEVVELKKEIERIKKCG